MPIRREDVLAVAALARLRLREAEVDRLSAELSRILDHVEALSAADIEGIAPFDLAAGGPAPLRPDEPGTDALAAPPSAMAPGWADPFFTVPRLPALDAGAAEPGESAG